MKYYTDSENKTCKFYIAGREKLEQKETNQPALPPVGKTEEKTVIFVNTSMHIITKDYDKCQVVRISHMTVSGRYKKSVHYQLFITVNNMSIPTYRNK
jgi:hypothetical protein